MTCFMKTVSTLSMGIFAALALSSCSGTDQTVQEQGTESVVGQTVQTATLGVPVAIGLTYIPNVQFAPVYLAAEDQIFAGAGLAASLRHHGAEEGLFTALLAGDEDVTIASGDEVLQARLQGADIVSIGAYYHAYPVEILVTEDSAITTMADLQGKKIGLPGEFGSNWFGLLAALKGAGMELNDINIVSVGFTQAAALISGQVDAVVGFSNSEAVQLESSDTSVRAIPFDSGNLPMVGASIITTSAWAEANPAAARQVVAAITAGADRVADNPQHALEVTQQWDTTLSDAKARKGATAVLGATIGLLLGPDGKATSQQNLETWSEMSVLLADILDEPELIDQLPGAVTNEYTDAK